MDRALAADVTVIPKVFEFVRDGELESPTVTVKDAVPSTVGVPVI